MVDLNILGNDAKKINVPTSLQNKLNNIPNVVNKLQSVKTILDKVPNAQGTSNKLKKILNVIPSSMGNFLNSGVPSIPPRPSFIPPYYDRTREFTSTIKKTEGLSSVIKKTDGLKNSSSEIKTEIQIIASDLRATPLNQLPVGITVNDISTLENSSTDLDRIGELPNDLNTLRNVIPKEEGLNSINVIPMVVPTITDIPEFNTTIMQTPGTEDTLTASQKMERDFEYSFVKWHETSLKSNGLVSIRDTLRELAKELAASVKEYVESCQVLIKDGQPVRMNGPNLPFESYNIHKHTQVENDGEWIGKIIDKPVIAIQVEKYDDTYKGETVRQKYITQEQKTKTEYNS